MVKIICRKCRKEFIVWKYRKEKAKFCSYSCWASFRIGKLSPLHGKKRLDISGKNHWKWKGGVTTLDNKERLKFRKTIQKVVFERDNYTCQFCSSKRDLQVDHIQSWSEYVELRFCIDNCRTLCKSCHYEITFGKPIPDPKMEWGHNFERS